MDSQSKIEIIRCLVIGIVLSICLVIFCRLVIRRSNTILKEWAAKNEFELLHFERCFLTGGFNFWTTSRNQIVFFVRVRDKEGREKSGWVRCGAYWNWIFLSDKAEVRWKNT
jgi:hypothetical protein